jgi:two-component system KDP operon response regulator KdpE
MIRAPQQEKNVKTVLVVGERPEQANALAETLGMLGLEAVASANDRGLVVRTLVAHHPSLIVIDVNASDESLSTFETIRDLSEVPIVVRGPMANASLVISYLEHGAADFTARTTPPAILAAKINNMLKLESDANRYSSKILVGDLTIDLNRRIVLKGAERICLTPIEFRLLKALAEDLDRPCTHKDLLERVWGSDFTDSPHYLRIYIGYLRQKLEDNPRRPRLLINEWGYGYRLREPREKDSKAGPVQRPQVATSG